MKGRFAVEPWARGHWPRVFLCLLFLAPALAQGQRLDLPFLASQIRLSTSKPSYWRYEMVEFSAEAEGPGLDSKDHPYFEVRLFQHGKPLPGLPGREACLLRFDANTQSWRGRWPIPWNPDLGDVDGRLAAPALAGRGVENIHFSGPGLARSVWVQPDRWAARTRFSIRGRQPAMLPPGFSVVTLEPAGRQYRLPGPEGGLRGPKQAFAWARMMDADAFWHCGFQTQVWGQAKPEDFPWNHEHLDQVAPLGQEALKQGIAYGAYMLTFLVGGDYLSTPYDFTLSYDRASGSLLPIRFVSMADPRRQRDIIGALKRLSDTAGVSYIGMDYVRANTGGLEFTDEFLSDLDLDLPEGLRQASVNARRRWLGRQLAEDNDERLQHLWDWWRAHRVSLVLKGILEEARPVQPVWVFSLGWEQGHQHGQDPRMLIDAGIGFNAPMFYEADGEQYPVMLADWKRYLRKTGGVLVLGQVVDAPLLHPRQGLNGPEEHYQRALDSLSMLGPSVDRLGFFWHDINRAISGGRSPYGSREWALAGASAFSRLREEAGTVPVSLELAQVTGTAQGLSGTVRVRSLSATNLDRLKVDPVWTPGLGVVVLSSSLLRNLAPGETRQLTFSAQVTERFVKERYRDAAPAERMLAFKARVPGSKVWRSAFAFKYWKESDGDPAPMTEVLP